MYLELLERLLIEHVPDQLLELIVVEKLQLVKTHHEEHELKLVAGSIIDALFVSEGIAQVSHQLYNRSLLVRKELLLAVLFYDRNRTVKPIPEGNIPVSHLLLCRRDFLEESL